MIGGGFIGSEIAAALAMNGKEVVMILPQAGIGSRLFPPDLAAFLNDYYREHGVEVLTHSTVTDVVRRGSRLHRPAAGQGDLGPRAKSRSTESWPGSALGPMSIWPKQRFAVDNGIVVDPFLRTSHPDVYAAGDVAVYWQSVLGQRRASNMRTTPRRWVASRDERWLANGSPTSTSPTSIPTCSIWATRRLVRSMPGSEVVAEWEEPYRTGVLTYRGDGRVRGALLWNVWDQIDAARALIADPRRDSRGR